MVATLRSRVGIYGAIIMIVVAVTVIALVGYRLYYATIAATPQKALRIYLDTLSRGDMVALYDMSRGSAAQTQAEFAAMMSALVAERRLTTEGAAIETIGRQDNVSYYRVMAKLLTSDGSYRLQPLIFEVVQEGNAWRVALFVPPSAYPSD